MNSATLAEKLAVFPRLHLGETPTPLEPLPRLSQSYQHRLLIKRDDSLGPGLGGNKTRKLEYLLAEAQQKGHKKVVTFGGLQSNHARLTVATANRLGLESHLFYFERRPPRLEGNLLLNHLLGARLHFIPLGGGGGMSLETTIRLVHLLALTLVGRHYFIPVGGHSWLGCLGYVRAALELEHQAQALEIPDAHLVVAAGSGGTLAGLLAGLALCGSQLRVLGIDVGKLWKGFPASIAALASEICEHFSSPMRFTPSEVPLIESTYVGSAYGVPSPAGQEALSQFAQQEGILLDPVYTAKAAAGLLDLLQNGYFEEKPVIFLHTGGLPALFAFGNKALDHG